MSAEQNKTVVRRWIEQGWNAGDLSLIDTLYTPDVVQHDPNSPIAVTNAETLKQYIGGFLAGFPGLHFTIGDLLAEGDKVLWRFTAQGTHTGTLMNIPPTGKSATITGMVLFRLMDGKIAEVWVNVDTLGMLQAIGVIPAPGQPA